MSGKKISIKNVLLIAIIILCAYTRGINFFVVNDYENVNRQFGSGLVITITTPIIIYLILSFIKNKKIFIKDLKEPIIIFMFFSIISLFFPIKRNIRLSIIAVLLIIEYGLLFLSIKSLYKYKEVYRCIDISFKISLIIQTILGSLKSFGGIKIPFITDSGVDIIRNGVYRMTGTFAHSGEFSMYIFIMFIYFLCQYYFNGKTRYLSYVGICLFDLFYSGSRTIILLSALIFGIIILIKYRKSIMVKTFYILVGIIGGFVFINSDAFYKLFIEKSFMEMLDVRFVHYIAGFRIMTRDMMNFLLGVGLNNNVNYIIENYNFTFNNISLNSIVSSGFMQRNPIHNSFLVIGVELGIVGLILYARIFLRELGLLKINKIDSQFKANYVFINVTIISYIIYGFQGWALLKNPLWIMLIIIISFASILRGEEKKNEAN